MPHVSKFLYKIVPYFLFSCYWQTFIIEIILGSFYEGARGGTVCDPASLCHLYLKVPH